ncbi:hypothetical protein WBG78_22940 [Chryseolinea sp. T2]|uniref:hypothetical protein n=1 Tax=Chryseolinea sp. T2 TaxID=3129255 RepID=UPI00307837C3
MRIFIAVILSSCFVNTIAQTYETISVEGTILFPVMDSIPQDIIFIRSHPNNLSKAMEAHWLYFQAMKWTQPDLSWEVARCKKESVIVDGKELPFVTLMRPGEQDFYLTYGKIVFKVYPDRKPEVARKEYLSVLHFAGDVYDIRYSNESPSDGIPMSFECLEW